MPGFADWRKILSSCGIIFFAAGSPAIADTFAAAVVDDGYAGKVLQKILSKGKIKTSQRLDIVLAVDDEGRLVNCKSQGSGDASAVCAAAKAVSPFGVPPYGVPSKVAISFWNSSNQSQGAPTQQKQAVPSKASSDNSKYISSVAYELRKSMYIPKETKKGKYQATARIKIDPEGKILESSIVKSSGDKLLDKYMLQGINRAGSVKKPPEGIGNSLDIPFTLIR